MKFNEKIVKLRKTKGLTQDEFAAAVGVSRQAVYKWESGQSYPEVPKMLEIKLLFDVSIDDLLDENYVVEIPEKPKKRRISRERRMQIEEAVLAEDDSLASVVKEAAPTAAPLDEKLEVFVDESSKKEAVYEKEESKSAPVSENSKAEDRKVGFFGRLFGRK